MTTATATPVPGTVQGVETFALGTYAGDKPGETWEFSPSDLKEIADNFRRLSTGPNPLHKVPVVVTHDGVEAYGWVKDCRPRGELLDTDWERVVPELKQAVDEGRLEKVSVEVKPDFVDRHGNHHGKYLYRVAVLGAQIPRVKGLADLGKAKWFTDPAPSAWADRPFRFADPPAAPPQKRPPYPPQAPGEGEGPKPLSVEEAVAFLREKGIEPPSDAAGPTVPEAFLVAVATAWKAESPEEGKDMSQTATPPQKPEAPPQRFSDADVAKAVQAAVERALAPLQAKLSDLEATQKALDTQATMRFAEEKRGRIEAAITNLQDQRKITNAHLDRGDPKDPLPTLRDILYAADAVKTMKFADGAAEMSLLDMLLKFLEKGAPLNFSERIPARRPGSAQEDPGQDGELKKLAERTKAAYEAEEKRRQPTRN